MRRMNPDLVLYRPSRDRLGRGTMLLHQTERSRDVSRTPSPAVNELGAIVPFELFRRQRILDATECSRVQAAEYLPRTEWPSAV